MLKQQEKAEAVKQFNKLEKKAPTYTDPWGWKGGLFYSALTVFYSALVISSGEINTLDIVVIASMILASGYMHSKTLSYLNTMTTAYDLGKSSLACALKTAHHLLEALNETRKIISAQDKEIETLKKQLEEVKNG